MQIREFGIDEIKPYEKNPRKNEDSVKFVANSIKEFGFKVPIVIDADNVIVAGHTRWKAAKQLGLEKVPCIKADDLSPAQIKAFRLADNKVGEFSQWDMDLLGDELKDLGDVFDMGDFGFFDPMDDDAPTGDDDDFDPDKAAEDIENPVSQPGDLWLLGRHRLICGDSCDEATIKRLCGDEAIDLYLTDPPYNVAYKGGTDKKLTIENDNMDSASFLAFLTDAYAAADSVLKPGCAFYIWHASCEVFNFYQAIMNIPGWMAKQYLLWVKDSFTLGRQDYQWKHEPCQPAGTKVVTPTGIVNIEDLKDGDVVVSYDSYSGLVKGTKNGGYKVKTAKRKYEGTLYGVRCNGMETWATDNHKFTVRFNSGAKKNFCTYLMKRGTRWRVGVTVCYDARQFGLKTRFKQENADAAWIIAVHESKEKAQIMEQLVAVKYGLPYTVWELDRGQKVPTSKRKYEDIDWLYDNLDPLRMELGARQLLEDYGRSIRYPLLTREICRDKFSTRVTATVAACNLIPGLMQVPVSTEYDYSTNKNFKWVEIDEIARKQYCDWVYSLDVEKYQHYIADGIVVHNCIYGWKDGAAHYFVDDRKQSTILEFDKPKRNGEHPTMKPVELFEKLVENSSRPGENVLDSFGGSGTTMVACEKLGRKAFLCELDPKYADVIVKRYINLHGNSKDVRLLKPDGTEVPYDEIAK